MFWRQLREKCLHSGLVWPVLRHIMSQYGNLFCMSPYSVQMWEKNRTRKKLRTQSCDFKNTFGKMNC